MSQFPLSPVVLGDRLVLDRPERLDVGLTPATPLPSTVVAQSAGNTVVRQMVWEFNAHPFTITDRTTNGGTGSIKLADVPARAIQVLSSAVHATALTSTGLAVNAAMTVALGTAAEATTGALTTTGSNTIMAATALATLSSGAGSGRAMPTSSTVVFVNAAAASGVEIFLNVGTNDGGSNPSVSQILTFTGRVVLTYICVGT